MRERVLWLYITCQCGLCKSPHEECGPTHQILPVHTFHTTHWELNCVTIIGCNRERISKWVFYRVFCVLYLKFPLSEALLHNTLLHVRSLACLT